MVWRVPGEGHGRPATDGSVVYFLSKHHEVVAVDARSGGVRWRQSTGEPDASTVGSAVVIAGASVVAGDYNLVAFDRTTGAIRWRFVPVIGHAPGIYLGEATDGLVLAGSPAGRAYAVSSATGALVWDAVIDSQGLTTVFQPMTDGSIVVAGYTTFTAPNRGGVVALDLRTGRELWRTVFALTGDPLLGVGSTGGPIPAGDSIAAARGDGTIYFMNPRNGEIRWSIPPVPDVPLILQGPFPRPAPATHADYRPLTIAGRTLVAGSLTGRVIAYDLISHREQWKYVDEKSGSVAFAISGDNQAAYVPFVSGRQVAINLSNGTERWRTGFEDGFDWPAISFGGRVYLAGDTGGFVALRP